MIVLFFAASGVRAQTPHQRYVGRDTWYEFLLKQFNRSNFDYGAWFEKRREVFLQATVTEPYFWYSVSVTAGMLLIMVAYTKLYLDHRRSMRSHRGDDGGHLQPRSLLHGRRQPRPSRNTTGTSSSAIARSRPRKQATAGPAGAIRRQKSKEQNSSASRVSSKRRPRIRNKLQEELRQKSLVVADLSMRLDALSKKVNGPRSTGGRQIRRKPYRATQMGTAPGLSVTSTGCRKSCMPNGRRTSV